MNWKQIRSEQKAIPAQRGVESFKHLLAPAVEDLADRASKRDNKPGLQSLNK